MLKGYKCIPRLKSLCLKPWFKSIMLRCKIYGGCSSASIIIKELLTKDGLTDTFIVNTIKNVQDNGRYSGHFVVYSEGFIFDTNSQIYIGELQKGKIINFKFGDYTIVDFKSEWEEYNIHSVKDLVENVKKYSKIKDGI